RCAIDAQFRQSRLSARRAGYGYVPETFPHHCAPRCRPCDADTLFPLRFAPHGTCLAVDPVPLAQTNFARTTNASAACNDIETNGESDRAAGAACRRRTSRACRIGHAHGQRVPDPSNSKRACKVSCRGSHHAWRRRPHALARRARHMSGEAPVKTTVNQWAFVAVVFAASAHAQEIYLQGGTQGVGIGAAVSFNSMLGAHADFNAIDLSHDFTVAGNRYQDDLKLRQGGLYADIFPWRGSGFRATLGLRFNDDELRGVSVPTNGTYVFGGKRYPALPGMYAVAEARYPTVMPYFGIGYGHRPASKGLGFVADLGVAYGIPKC
uniref:Uncharacterized protein n=2 Tax=Medicago truncatula TaxID=3880 RepID=A0A0D9SGM6_MEDTR